MNKIKEIYIKLESKDFLILVSGRQVEKEDRDGNKVHLILSDIGFDKMLDNIQIAIDKSR